MSRGSVIGGGAFYDRLQAARRQILVEALTEHRGNRTHAARSLELQRTYFIRLLRRHGIIRDRGPGDVWRSSAITVHRAEFLGKG